MRIKVEWRDRKSFDRFEAGVKRLGGNDLKHAMRRAVNRAGDSARTKVKRQVAKQMGLPQKRTVANIDTTRADYSSLSYTIIGKRRFILLTEFKARQTRRGVSAAPWANRSLFRGAFFAYGKSSVFRRVGGERGPIKSLWGGSVHRELARDKTPLTFSSTAMEVVANRLVHEISRLIK